MIEDPTVDEHILEASAEHEGAAVDVTFDGPATSTSGTASVLDADYLYASRANRQYSFRIGAKPMKK